LKNRAGLLKKQKWEVIDKRKDIASVMMCQKKNKFKRQEHRTFVDWFISVPAKITRSGHRTEIKMYENYYYEANWEKLYRLIEAA